MSCGSVLPGVVTLLVFGLSSQAGVAIAAGQSGEPQATLSKAVEIDQQALAQLQAGKYEAAREALWGAIAILNGANRGDDEITAQIHMHLAAVYLTGFNDRKKAIRQFVLALKINPNSTIAPQVETAALDDAFDAARSQFGLGSQVKRASPTASTGETPSDSMIEERATSASGTSDPSVAKVPNATPPIGSADKPNVVPAVDGAAHTTNAAPALLLPDGETSVKSTPAVGDKGPLEEVGRRPPIDEDLPKHHRRLPGSLFFSFGYGTGWTHHGSANPDGHDMADPERPASITITAGWSPASIFQFVPEIGYQLSDRLALSLQERFQYRSFDIAESWLPLPGASAPPTYALALFFRAQYAFLNAGDFQFFGSGVAGFGLVGGRTFMGYVPKTCGSTGPFSHCPVGTNHSNTISGGPGAFGLGVGATYHISPGFAVWVEVRGISSVAPVMELVEFNTGLAVANNFAAGGYPRTFVGSTGSSPRASTEPCDSADSCEDAGSDSIACVPEKGHIGLVLGMAKNLGGDGPRFGYGLGLRGGYRFARLGEIGLLVAALGGADSLTVDAIPILFQFNGILPVNPILSFFGGVQLGLLHYRLNTAGMAYDNGVVGMDAFASGPQVGTAVRLASRLSLRFELSLLHATPARTTVTSSNSTDSYSIQAANFLQAYGAFCIVL